MAFLLLRFVALWIVAVLVASVSSWCRRPGTAATVLLSLWVLGGIVLPRFAAMTASATMPLPSRDAFEAAMREDREQGLDGHNPRDERRMKIEQEVMQEYGVATKQELPINLDGILMQADEDYGNDVWDTHFGKLEVHQLRQSNLVGLFSLVNPLQATERVSMALAGTDLQSHFSLLQQVESRRRALVRSLNEEHAHGGSKTGDWAWKPEPDFYASFATFRFEAPLLRDVFSARSLEWAALLAWALGLSIFLVMSARRLERGASL